MFFDNWWNLLRILVIGVCIYVWLIVLLRVAGKRALSKMNAFDWILTVAMGSTLATVLLNKSVALVEGMLAFVLLIGLQLIVAIAAVRSKKFSRLIKSQPTLLFYRGNFLDQQMRSEHVSREEILQMIRSNGSGKLEDVAAVVIETNGELSVLTTDSNLTTAQNVTLHDDSPPQELRDEDVPTPKG